MTTDRKKRPAVYIGQTFSIDVSTSSSRRRLYITVNGDPPIEVFIRASLGGSLLQSFAESLGRMISISLRYNVPLEEIISQLTGIKDESFWDDGVQYLSLPDAVGQTLKKAKEHQCLNHLS